MASAELKCQFCTLNFTSVHKIIPHVYFGHRKKISRYVRDHQEVRLKCPASCDFSHGVGVEKSAGPEVIFPILSKVFMVMEDHMLDNHTKEKKLTMCPYCQKSLENLVYWEHLEEHMGSNSSPGPTTPTARTSSTTPTPKTPGTPVTPVKSDQSPTAGSPILKTPTKLEVSTVEQEPKTEVPDVKHENDSTDKQEISTAEQTKIEWKSEKPGYTAIKSPTKSRTSPKVKLTYPSIAGHIDPSEEVVGFLEPVIVENLPPLDEKVSLVDGVQGSNISPKVASPKVILSKQEDKIDKERLKREEEKRNQEEIEKLAALKRQEDEKRKQEENENKLKELERKIALKRAEEEKRKQEEIEKKIAVKKAEEEKKKQDENENKIIEIERKIAIKREEEEKSKQIEIEKKIALRKEEDEKRKQEENERKLKEIERKNILKREEEERRKQELNDKKKALKIQEEKRKQEETENKLKEIDRKIALKKEEGEKRKQKEIEQQHKLKTEEEEIRKHEGEVATQSVSPQGTEDQKRLVINLDTKLDITTSSISTNEGDLSLILEVAPDEMKDFRGSNNTSLETSDITKEKHDFQVDLTSEIAKTASKAKVSDQRREEIKRELAEIERKIKEKKEEEKKQALLKLANIVSIDIEHIVPDFKEVLHVKDPEDSDNVVDLNRRKSTENKKDIDLWEERRKEEEEKQKISSVVSKRRVSGAELAGRKESSLDGRVEERKKEPSSGNEMRVGLEPSLRSRESSGDQVRSREVSGEQEISRSVRSRNTSGDKRSTRSVWSRETSGEPVQEESGRRSASQESRDSTSQDRAMDSTSQERRESTSRRMSGGEQSHVKQKPVLTEEMERKIIYGGFKKKESREDKLTAVKREIETRFKEEEARKIKLQEEKRKAEDKEREKQRLNDEKLKKEREKLKEEKKKLRQSEKSAKENEEVQALLDEKEPTPEEEEEETNAEPSEDISVVSSVEDTPKSSPPRDREKSPDQYQKIKMEIMKIDIEIEKKQAARQAEKRKDESRSPSPVEKQSLPKLAKPSSPNRIRKVPGVQELPKHQSVAKKPILSQDTDPEEMDDLEMMMRDFQEREAKEKLAEVSGPQQPVDSLSQLRDSYAPKAKSLSPSPPRIDNKPIIPSGFDADGHPLPVAPLSTLGKDPVLVRAANNAARGIMGPARSNLQSQTLQLQCSLCKEEGHSASYYSGYQLLSHVFLAHRKKIVSRSRKARGMTLACPEGCGYTTTSSSQGVSIDFFNTQLPLHLSSLCEHIISSHTGEDKMDSCQFCSLPLDHDQGWSWQHLANHRDARRVYCDSCNNFPFKNEEHKCSGQPELGTNSPVPGSRNTSSPGGTASNPGTPKSDKTTKSLEELAREVESGVIKPEELSKQRHLGRVSVWVCGVCDQTFPALSGWLAHTRSHLPTGMIRLPNHLKCFCCQWRPARFDKGSEVLALHQLVSHLLAEHSNPAWSDQFFEEEKVKLEQIVKDHEKRVEREKEEKGIIVPRLPSKCNNCKEIISDPNTWKYHVLAHKFGEVFCSTCMTCVLGHRFGDHKVTCTSDKKAGAKARVEKYRGDTWLDVGGKKLKVFYEYDESEDLGRVTIAKCMVKGNLPMMGVGVNHEEAANVLKEEVEDYFSTLKEQEDTVNKAQGSQEDKQALLDMFIELVKIDQENEIEYFLTVGGIEAPVNTRMEFTKLGKVQIVAMVEVRGEMVNEVGNTRKEAVNNLAEKVGHLESEKDNKKSAKFCCVECGSRFSKEVSFKMHQTIKCHA